MVESRLVRRHRYVVSGIIRMRFHPPKHLGTEAEVKGNSSDMQGNENGPREWACCCSGHSWQCMSENKVI
jgi:hypothetical protein